MLIYHSFVHLSLLISRLYANILGGWRSESLEAQMHNINTNFQFITPASILPHPCY